MRMTVVYDVGEGQQERTISPKAMIGWELATKQKMSDFATGIGIGDLSWLLFEQMKHDGDAPESRAVLVDSLVDIGPKTESPTSPDEALSSDSSPS